MHRAHRRRGSSGEVRERGYGVQGELREVPTVPTRCEKRNVGTHETKWSPWPRRRQGQVAARSGERGTVATNEQRRQGRAHPAQRLTRGAWGLGRGLGEDRWRRSRTRTMRWLSRRRKRVRRHEGLRGPIQRCSGSRGPRRSCRTCRGDERATVATTTAIDGDGGARASRTEARKGTRRGLWAR